MIELWDAYDTQFNIIENVRLVRGEPIPKGLYHLVCEIIVKHTDGSFLLMQRDLEKHLGGMWELTAGGSALIGESPLDCAIRELREETGIESEYFQEITRIVHDDHRSLYVEYLCVTTCDKNKITLQSGETIAYQWLNKDAILRMDTSCLASSRSLKILKENNI